MSTIYVGNLKWEATEESLRELFSPIGEVSSIKIIMDRDTGRPRGFAFIAMENSAQAIQELNGKEFMGRPLKINEATDKPPQRDRQPQGEDQPRNSQGHQGYRGPDRADYSGGDSSVNFSDSRRDRADSRQRKLDHKKYA